MKKQSMNYEERKALLGLTVVTKIDAGFLSDSVPDRTAGRNNDLMKPIGKRLKFYELTDLSALNDKRCEVAQRTGRLGGLQSRANRK